MATLTGKAALVTGAGRGIGRGVALALAEAGADVAVNDYGDLTGAEQTVRDIEKLGRKARVAAGDVSDYDTLERLIADSVDALGPLSIAVSSAVYSDREMFYEADLEKFHRTVDVTMWGAFHLVRASARRMIEQGSGGSIVLIGSPHSYTPIASSMAYNMSKAAVDMLARTAALELIEHRIRVNVVTPGWIDTPGERKFFTEEGIEKAGTKLPWGRLGRPDEIGRGVVFLCDPQSDYLTGSRILIDGGITLPWWAGRGSGVPQ